MEGSTRYLMAQIEGGGAALLEWPAIGDAAQKPGLFALVAGGSLPLGFTTATPTQLVPACVRYLGSQPPRRAPAR